MKLFNNNMDIFYHICALPGSDWVEIVKRQTNLIESSGLLNKVDSIYIGFLGKDKSQLDFLVKKTGNIKENTLYT